MTGYNAFKLALTSPGDTISRDLYSQRLAHYNLLWDAYKNALFDRRNEAGLNAYDTYLKSRGLYISTRPIYNLTGDQVDFYAFHLYPGIIGSDGAPTDGNMERAFVFSKEASPELQDAIFQALMWSQWARGVVNFVTKGAACGDTFAKVVDDVNAGRVRAVAVAPWHVKEADFSDTNHITYLKEEYSYYDREADKVFKFTGIYTKDRFETYRDNQPYDYNGNGAVYDNPYRFVPWVYSPHRATETLPGEPALRGFRALEEVNSIQSRLNDYIISQANTPILLAGGGKISVEASVNPEKDKIKILTAENPDVNAVPLTGNLSIGEAREVVNAILAELKERNIEATTWQRIRETGDTSGRAVRLMLGDVLGRMRGVAGNYDAAHVSLFRQLVAIGGMRFKEGRGGWAQKTAQQKLFSPFDLQSYERGDLDFQLLPRDLIPDSDLEIAQARLTNAQAFQAEAEALDMAQQKGTLEMQWREMGFDEERIAEKKEMMRKGKLGAFQAANQDVIPTVAQ